MRQTEAESLSAVSEESLLEAELQASLNDPMAEEDDLDAELEAELNQ